MHFGVLGTVELRNNASAAIDLGWPKQRLVLAILLSNANRSVSFDQLTELVWGDNPPAAAHANLHTYTHRIRRLVRDPGVLTGDRTGYRLAVEPGRLDSLRFEALVAEAERAQAEGRLDRASGLLDEALSLWRGEEAYAGVEEVGPVRNERVRLAEKRLTAMEIRFDVELARGRHATVVSDLQSLVALHPLRERLRGQLMLTLHRSGRKADALAVFHEYRHTLTDRLGLDPGRELRQLHDAIQSDDPGLSAPGPIAVRTGQRVPAQLPAELGTFTGRGSESSGLLDVLTRDDPSPTVCTITGAAGVGKSALAVHVAHRVAHAFPDGQLYIDLQGSTPGLEPLAPAEVLRRLLRALGQSDTDIPFDAGEMAERCRSLIEKRRMLVVLDNATDEAQIAPLLSRSTGSAALITSRRDLNAHPATQRTRLDGLGLQESLTLLRILIGHERVQADPQAAEYVASLCGYLPLALRIVGARLAARPDWTLAAFAEHLRTAHSRLDELQTPDLAVRASLDLSLHDLRRHQNGTGDARLIELVSVLDIPEFTAAVAAAAAAETSDRAAERLRRLEAAQLVRSISPGRYRMHDLVRLYARELAAEHHSTGDRGAAVLRGLEHFLAIAREVAAILSPDSVRAFGQRVRAHSPASAPVTTGEAAEWIEAEAAGLVSIAVQGAATSAECRTLAAELAIAAWAPLRFRGSLRELVDLAQMACRIGDARQARTARIKLAIGYRQLGRIAEAGHHAEQAVAAQRRVGPSRGLAAALNALAGVQRMRGLLDAAESHYREAVEVCEVLHDHEFLPIPLTNLGNVQQDKDDLDQAVGTQEHSASLAATFGTPEWQAISQCNLAEALRRSGHPATAVDHFERAIGLLAEAQNRQAEPVAWWNLGYAHDDLGHRNLARACWRTALDQLEKVGALTSVESQKYLKQPRPPIPEPIRCRSAGSPPH